jgi:hypothetical protein
LERSGDAEADDNKNTASSSMPLRQFKQVKTIANKQGENEDKVGKKVIGAVFSKKKNDN